MFKIAPIDPKITKAEFRILAEEYRTELVRCQGLLRDSNVPAVIVVAGNDLLGCNEILNFLHGWLDPRYLEANAFRRPSDDEKERPLFWRYWHALPQKGRLGIFIRAWVAHTIVGRLEGRISDSKLEHRIQHSRKFEKLLVDDGMLLLKFWLHLPKSELKKRLRAAAKHPDKAWRVHPQDRKIYEQYDDARPIARQLLKATSIPEAPWTTVNSTNRMYRDLRVAQDLLVALHRYLPEAASAPSPRQVSPVPRIRSARKDYLGDVDLTKALSKEKYTERLNRYQAKLYHLTHELFERGISTVMAFEGWDAAGKGGAIRRLTGAIDASIYRVFSIAKPTPEELRYNYLWRFWNRIPGAGNITIFDRSWYGRVLVERVEAFAAEAEWKRAYNEINDFEEQLIEHGIIFLKFWVHIDADEQLLRFKEREGIAFKQHKMSEEDYRNRKRWPDYEAAANDMIEMTNTDQAPWHLIAGNDKRWARIAVLKAVCRRLQGALK